MNWYPALIRHAAYQADRALTAGELVGLLAPMLPDCKVSEARYSDDRAYVWVDRRDGFVNIELLAVGEEPWGPCNSGLRCRLCSVGSGGPSSEGLHWLHMYSNPDSPGSSEPILDYLMGDVLEALERALPGFTYDALDGEDSEDDG